jgi:hypothetical protein
VNDWTSSRLGPVDLSHPANWRARDKQGLPVDGLMSLDVPEGLFAPTLTVTTNAFDGTVEGFSTVVMAGNMALLSGYHLLSVEDHAGGAGRRYEFVHDQDGTTLHCIQTAVLRGSLAVTVTATCAEYQVPALDGTIRRILESVHLDPSAAEAGAAPPVPFNPGREPRLEEFASVQAGRPLEALSGIAATQPYRSTGPWFGPADLRLLRRLGESAGNGGLGRLEVGSHRAALDTLQAAGLADAAGRLTGQGRVVTGPLRETTASFRIQSQLDGRTSLLQLWFGRSGECLVLAGPSAHEQFHAGAEAVLTDRQQIDLIPAAEAAATVAAWLGLGPSWPLSTRTTTVPADDYAARLHGATEPPAGLDEAMRHAWRQPWLLWQVEGPGLGSPVSYVNAGAAGQLRARRAGTGVALEPTSSRNAYRHLSALLAPPVVERGLDAAG